MAKKINKEESEFTEFGNIFSELKGMVNKRLPGSAYLLSDEDSPTDIKAWISTGSYHLDTIISNLPDRGGIPVGRIVQIFGLESVGKSLIAVEASINVQKMGGIAVYIDTEAATTKDRLVQLGLDPTKLLYVCVPIVEEVFEVMDTILTGLMEKFKSKKDKPLVLITWDSVAQTSTKAEYESEYDDQQMGSLARAISKGMRKITQLLPVANASMLCLNQLTAKFKLQNIYEYPWLPAGGKKLGYVSSVIIQVDKNKKIEGEDKATIGFETTATIIKNKVAVPARKCKFDLMFSSGIEDRQHILTLLQEKKIINQISTQKSELTLENGDVIDFKNSNWEEIYDEHSKYIEKITRQSLIIDTTNYKLATRTFEYDASKLPDNATFDPETGEPTLKQVSKKEKKIKEAEQILAEEEISV